MCGFVGMVGEADCAGDILLALQALQHRGQDSAGIGTIHQNQFPVVRKLGLVGQGFGLEDISSLPGNIGIGHVRYPTVGSGNLRDTQPFWYRQPGVLMAHNGNFVNIHEMKQALAEDSVHLMSSCDVEPVLCLFSLELMRQRRKNHSVEDAIQALRLTLAQAKGAYSIVAALVLDGQHTLIALRDPLGIRPAVWGEKKGAWVVASESVALDAMDATLYGDILPGQVMLFQNGQQPRTITLNCLGSTPCVFEHIYFARPDSLINESSVYSVRLALGKQLAQAFHAKGLEADVVIPIPDTSRPSANALAEELGLPYREGFIKNRYSGRTFIMSSAGERTSALKLKLNPIRSEFKDRRILVVDDSIVRGTTLKRTIKLIRDQSPREVHLAIHSPPVVSPCYYGIDMSTPEELLASPCNQKDHPNQQELEIQLANQLGLDSLTYLPLIGLQQAFGQTHCAACFDGRYPLALTNEQRQWIEQDRKSNCGRCPTG